MVLNGQLHDVIMIWYYLGTLCDAMHMMIVWNTTVQLIIWEYRNVTNNHLIMCPV